jgi:Nucleotidyl transferase AbiEii toxin, Type IV TA system
MNADERAAIAQQFGVAPEQVERDHLVSHLLAFLSQDLNDRIQFIGGTALAGKHLPDGRLSEDIDLVAIDDRKAVAADLDSALPRALALTHGRLTLAPPLSGVADTGAAMLRSATGVVVRIQLLSARGRAPWPTERRSLVQRYRDAPPRPKRQHGQTVMHLATSGTYGRLAQLELSMPTPSGSTDNTVRPISLPDLTCSRRRRPRPNGVRNLPAKPGSPSTPPMPSRSFAKHGLA